MLIHKKSLGVLFTVLACYDNVLQEVIATVDNLQRIDIQIDVNDWWFVPNSAPLARRIIRCYPDFIPIVNDDGDLVDIVDLKQRQIREQRDAEEAERVAQLHRDAEARGYEPVRKTRVAPMSMGYLQDTLKKRIQILKQ